MVVVISDLLAETKRTLRGLRMLRQQGHDVLVFHLMDDDELDFPFEGPTRFDDLETELNLNCNPRALREGYLEEVQKFLSALNRGTAQSGIDYQLVRTSTPVAAFLTKFLSRRLASIRRS